MYDFLIFKTFITPTLLPIIYIAGVLVIPIFAWLISAKFLPYIPTNITTMAKISFGKLRLRDKMIIVTIALSILLCMEICWRMTLEYLVAFMQMRDALAGA